MANEYDPNNYGPRAQPRHRDPRRSVPLTGAAEALYQHARIAEYPGEHPVVAQAEHASMILDVIHEAKATERAELIALCRSLKSEHWTPAKHDGLDGLDRLDYYDAACEDIARAILARSQ